MPQPNRRIRRDTPMSRDRYDGPDYSDYSSDTEDDYERRPRAPRRKSTLRDTIDRVSRSIGRLGINRSPSRTRNTRRRSPSSSLSRSPSPPPTSSRRRPAYTRRHSSDAYYPPSSSRRPRNYRQSSYSLSPPRTRDRDRDRDYDRRRNRSRSSGPLSNDKRLQHAARSALDAAVVEVMRVRKEPGSWTGGKGARVATAALGAAAVDAFVANGGGKDPERHGTRKKVESALGGLLLNRVVNGPRRELRGRRAVGDGGGRGLFTRHLGCRAGSKLGSWAP